MTASQCGRWNKIQQANTKIAESKQKEGGFVWRGGGVSGTSDGKARADLSK